MDWLRTLGLNKKQGLVYMHLLENGNATASELAQRLGEQRTNIYLLLDALTELSLVEKDESRPVAQFKVTNPNQLQQLMTQKQKAVSTSSAQLKQALPELLGLYHLNVAHEGMAYFEGLKGYGAALEDMNKANGEVCIFGATQLEEVRIDAWAIAMNKLQKRAAAKVRTKIIFEKTRKNSSTLSVDRLPILQSYMEARFWGNAIFEGEVVVYDSTVVLTSYDDKLVSLVIKNSAIAVTFKTIFDTAWENAEIA